MGHRRLRRPQARARPDAGAQDGLYTLITRAADGDRFEVIGSVSRAHAAADHDAWLGYLASPQVRAVTVTVTEAGYLRGADGGLDRTRDDVQADVDDAAPRPHRPACARRRRGWSPGSPPGAGPTPGRSP